MTNETNLKTVPFLNALTQLESAIALLKAHPDYLKLEKHGFLDTQIETAESAIASLRSAYDYMNSSSIDYSQLDEIVGFDWEPLEPLEELV